MPNNPIIHIQDDFFEDGKQTRNLILSTTFQDVTSPVDLVTYPDINLSIPDSVKEEFLSKLSEIMCSKIQPNFLFARAMIHDRPVPHKVHSDFNMGDYSAHVYLSLDWPEHSGTSFYKHDSEGYEGMLCTDWSKINHNSLSCWSKYAHVEAKFNRVLVHDSKHWHMAEPHNAWGDSPENGRLVLTCFFNKAK